MDHFTFHVDDVGCLPDAIADASHKSDDETAYLLDSISCGSVEIGDKVACQPGFISLDGANLVGDWPCTVTICAATCDGSTLITYACIPLSLQMDLLGPYLVELFKPLVENRHPNPQRPVRQSSSPSRSSAIAAIQTTRLLI